MIYEINLLKNEKWWGGSSFSTEKSIPFSDKSDYFLDLENGINQTAPFYLSSEGRYIWSEKPFVFSVQNGKIRIKSDYSVELNDDGKTLKEAYLNASVKHFPFSGKMPDLKFFETAQYNTWMEFDYNPTQSGVLDYARKIVENGYLPGVLIIDEGWHTRYGLWEWDYAKFPDPKAMISELHSLGFIVMLWIVPFFTADGREFAFIRDGKSDTPLLKTDDGEIAIVKWWNGYGAVCNLCAEADRNYLSARLKKLTDEFGVDGFKFDGGDISAYSSKNVINGRQTKYSPDEMNIAWNDFGQKFRYHEFKDTFKGGGKPSVQRLIDRRHSWSEDGITTIIPSVISQGLIGHPFTCPDMVGGGEYHANYDPNFKIDEELFIRMEQVSAFLPMIQFSWAPWRILSKKNKKICLSVIKLREKYISYIIGTAKESAITGEPIIRSLAYEYPHCGYEEINDQYMVGNKILVAPVLEKGAEKRKAVLPEGKWLYLGKDELSGGKTVEVKAPLNVLPFFVKVNP